MEEREKIVSAKSLHASSHPNGFRSPRNCQNWPNEWEAIFDNSESSDFLSQSVASSTSWSDELEGDLTKSLQEQMTLVDNTLYRDGSQQLSARSALREECRLWQKNFPHLRIVGESLKPSVGCQTRSRQEEVEEYIDEIITAHGDYDECVLAKPMEDTEPDQTEIYKEKIKKAVIDQIFSLIWPEIVKKIEPVLRKTADNQRLVKSISPELNVKDYDSFDDGLTSGFNSLTLVEDLSVNSLRTRSGLRSGIGVRKNLSTPVPIKPIVLECSIPIPSSVTVRASSALRRSPGRSGLQNLAVKYPSPERLLSPLVLQSEVKTLLVKSAGGRKGRGAGDRRQECRQRPQYDARTGRMINRDEVRSGLRRNLKTSPQIPWSRHGALPPIEMTDSASKVVDSVSKRSASAFFKGGRLNSGTRPNTSLTAKVMSFN